MSSAKHLATSLNSPVIPNSDWQRLAYSARSINFYSSINNKIKQKAWTICLDPLRYFQGKALYLRNTATKLSSEGTCDFWSHFCRTPNCFWNFFCRRMRSLSFCLALLGRVCRLNCVRFLRSLSRRRFLCKHTTEIRLLGLRIILDMNSNLKPFG